MTDPSDRWRGRPAYGGPPPFTKFTPPIVKKEAPPLPIETFVGPAYGGPHPEGPRAAPAYGGPPTLFEDRPDYDVFLEGPVDHVHTLAAMKLFREMSGCGLSTAKEAVTQASEKEPWLVKKDVRASDARLLKDDFEKFGAKVALR